MDFFALRIRRRVDGGLFLFFYMTRQEKFPDEWEEVEVAQWLAGLVVERKFI